MSEERFVDPNSGAAPQPGSYAGPEAAEKGFGPPPVTVTGESALTEEVVPSAYEAPGLSLVPEPEEDVEEPEDEADEESEEDDEEESEESDEEPEEDEEESEEDYAELLSGTVPEVLAYIEAHPDEKEAVQAAEAAGQGRVGIANA